MPSKELKGIFPNLAISAKTITSSPDINYNCVAWVFKEKSKWIDTYDFLVPTPPPEYFWPEGIPNNSLPQTYVELFMKYGFELTNNIEVEEGIEKIAIYTHEGEFSHVARLLENSLWTSKLGNLEDIQHELQELHSDLPYPYNYGEASIFMQRPS